MHQRRRSSSPCNGSARRPGTVDWSTPLACKPCGHYPSGSCGRGEAPWIGAAIELADVGKVKAFDSLRSQTFSDGGDAYRQGPDRQRTTTLMLSPKPQCIRTERLATDSGVGVRKWPPRLDALTAQLSAITLSPCTFILTARRASRSTHAKRLS